MKLTYDPWHNVAYLRLGEKATHVETLQVSGELNVDISPDGTVYGIEMLNANEQFQAEDKGNLVIVNQALGQSIEISLRDLAPLAPHA